MNGVAFLAFGNAFVLIIANFFCALSREGIGDRKEPNRIVVEHNGQVFRFNEVVHLFYPDLPAYIKSHGECQ